MKLFSTAEILTLNALATLREQNIDTRVDPHTFKLINYVVQDVCYQLEQTPELSKHNIIINNH